MASSKPRISAIAFVFGVFLAWPVSGPTAAWTGGQLPALTDPTFQPADFIDLGVAPITRIAQSDFNGDGNPDLAFTSHDVFVLLGDGAGDFSQSAVLNAGPSPVPLAPGDFDGDGNMDLAVGCWGCGNVWIYLGDGTGQFDSPSLFPDTGAEAYDIEVQDFNEDGKLDLAIGHQSGNLDILLGDGLGGFSSPVSFLNGHGPVEIRAADFNNDGHVDLLTAGSNLAILFGDGVGGFTEQTLPMSAGQPGVADVNGDGSTDLVVSGPGSNISVMLGNGSGAFGPAATFPTSNSPNLSRLALADMNGDGLFDVVALVGWIDAGDPFEGAEVLLGDGQGGFGAPITLEVAGGPHDLAIGDWNGDGRQDIAVTAYFVGGVSILINSTSTISYNICPLFDQTKAYKAGSTVPIQLQLCDAAGNNLSSASVPLVATGVYQVSTNAPGPLEDSGYANPDFQFRYAGGKYIFNLSLKGFTHGTYALTFTAGGDPTTHTVRFQVK